MLTLAEDLLLLALDDEKGAVIFSSSTALPYGLAGALLVELHLREKINFIDGKLVVEEPMKTGDELLDEVIDLLNSEDDFKDVKYWVQKITSKVKKMHDRLSQNLVDKDILKKEEHKFLWLIPYDRFPTKNSTPEMEMRVKIRNAVLNDEKPDDRTLALICLMEACSLVDEIFAKDERKKARKVIKELAESDEVSHIVNQIVHEITTVIVTVLASTAATTAITTG